MVHPFPSSADRGEEIQQNACGSVVQNKDLTLKHISLTFPSCKALLHSWTPSLFPPALARDGSLLDLHWGSFWQVLTEDTSGDPHCQNPATQPQNTCVTYSDSSSLFCSHWCISLPQGKKSIQSAGFLKNEFMRKKIWKKNERKEEDKDKRKKIRKEVK